MHLPQGGLGGTSGRGGLHTDLQASCGKDTLRGRECKGRHRVKSMAKAGPALELGNRGSLARVVQPQRGAASFTKGQCSVEKPGGQCSNPHMAVWIVV